LIIADLTNKVTDMKPQIPTLLLTVAALGWLIYVSVLRNARAADPALPDDIRSRAAALLEERKRLDQTIWKDEVLAQEYEQVFVNLWDALRAADDKLKVVEEFAFPRLVLGQPEAPQSKDLGITVTGFGGPGKTLDRAAWQRLLTQYREDGIEIVQTEWHHAAFDPANPQAVRSTVNMTMHLLNRRTHTRTIIKGPPKVVWEPRPNASELAQVQTIDATDITIYARQGEPTFRRAYAIQPSARSQGNADPLLLPFHIYDLNKDGLSEIIIPSLNSVRVNKGNWEFESFSLFKYPLRNRSLVGVFADFTGDGWADFLCAGAGPLALFVADAAGRFSLPPRQAASDAVAFDNASVFTAGDVDGDGDLDVWVGQYKEAYKLGQMQTPFYDANDGFADYLLQNDGKGNFVDVTEKAGLAKKRFRRSYGGSLIDLDDDLDLDLVVCADFAGLDAYLNDGQGRFTDVSESLVDQRHSFGMSLSFADYDLDGKTDIFMTGMGSTTARRLDRMNLNRDDFPMHTKKRMPMGYGNRMYLARDAEDGSGRRFPQASFNAQVARTGWSWGTSSFDFDNDGDRDIYVANGFLSQGSAKDYCTHYWRQDIYMGNSLPNPVLVELQKHIPAMSWNAYEHNSLLMNEAGRGFVNVAFLMGVAFEFDSRSVVSDDLDGDGRMDLIVYRHSIGTEYPFEIYALENRLETDRHWIGLRLQAGAGGSVMGATVVLRTAAGKQIAKVVSGDSYYCQHAPVLHFGLGAQTSVESIEVIWIDGSRQQLDAPAIDRYDTASAAK
jgi:hypothetical protein